MIVEQENTCIGCGCTENDPCGIPGAHGRMPCAWLLVDLTAGRGVCSACPDDLRRFIAGDRSLSPIAQDPHEAPE